MHEFIRDDEDLQEVISSKVSDNLILNIVHLVNIEAITDIDLTLFCKGAIITGEVISGKEYFSSMSAKFEGKSSVLQKLYADVGEEFYSKDEPPVNYIHLKNVAVKDTNESFTKINGGFLRMRIDEIDGHLFGSPS
ncbi:hypothetical protein ABNT06_05945 [Kosakonia sacchari]|uniref:hypothetical protein n=1 Tax=Kosakonia sacchari TaxID=1158459 RepID=UPI0032D92855